MADLRPLPQPAPEESADERLRRVVLIVRQGLYGIADELGRVYGLDRPCKDCDRRRRQDRGAGPSRGV